MSLTIEDLLKEINNSKSVKLENNAETWKRIGKKDSFPELNLPKGDLESFLAEWVANNPYNNI